MIPLDSNGPLRKKCDVCKSATEPTCIFLVHYSWGVLSMLKPQTSRNPRAGTQCTKSASLLAHEKPKWCSHKVGAKPIHIKWKRCAKLRRISMILIMCDVLSCSSFNTSDILHFTSSTGATPLSELRETMNSYCTVWWCLMKENLVDPYLGWQLNSVTCSSKKFYWTFISSFGCRIFWA